MVQADDQTLIDPKKLFAYGSLMEGYFNCKTILRGKVQYGEFCIIRPKKTILP